MIVVDTSVWIDHLNDKITQKVIALRSLIGHQPVLVGDIILCEVLQGLQSEREARAVETALRRFEIVSMLNPRLAVQAAAHFRTLRTRGITIRKTIDLIIGTFCIANDHTLLHDDRDFNPMAQYLGLRTR
ncbi:MAG TPA: PIN domain nuclease [Stellaceae bacterium]|nr:PIN domain nuclease [Stellaceae bacterium]